MVKNPLANAVDKRDASLSQEDALKEKMATYSSILVWRIPWIEDPGSLKSKGLQRVGHN